MNPSRNARASMLRYSRVAEPITRMTPLTELPELLRVEEAAAYLGISRGLAYELARQGQLASVKLGRLLRIKRDGLEVKNER
jgi:excisionase family DNA binding protein